MKAKKEVYYDRILKKLHQNNNDRWRHCISRPHGQAQQALEHRP